MVLTKMDMFGSVPKLAVRGRETITSPLGGIFTICLMFVVLIELVPKIGLMISNEIISITREDFWDEDAIVDISNQHLVIGATWKNDNLAS